LHFIGKKTCDEINGVFGDRIRLSLQKQAKSMRGPGRRICVVGHENNVVKNNS
jgi:hypothetical protein